MSNQTTKKNIHAGHRERVRDNVLENGFKQLEDHRLLELLLFYSIPRGDTNDIAHRLLNEFGSLSEVIKASPDRLIKVSGIGMNSAIQLSAIGELCVRSLKDGVVKKTAYKNKEDIIKLVRSNYLNESIERLLLVCFDSGMRLKYFGFLSEGDSISTDIDFKQLVSKIVEHDAGFVVIAHNHPEGEAAPSAADIATTSSISVMLRKLNVVLADHIILNSDSTYSMREDPNYANMFG